MPAPLWRMVRVRKSATMSAPPDSTAHAATAAPPRHHWAEDVQGLLTGTLLVGLAAVMYQHSHMLTGGTFGLAFLAHYASGWRWGLLFSLINLPFYWLAWRRMGWVLTLKTLAAVSLLSLWTELLPRWIGFARLDPLLAAVLAGVLTGTGLLILFRHRATLGGLNILVLYLQDTRGWSAGLMQMALDALIVVLALFIVPWPAVALSVLSGVVLNAVLAINHRPGRYMAA